MTPDAKLRMDVYREGQLAFNAGTECPYRDWRAGTWVKGRAAAEAYHAEGVAVPPTPPQDDSDPAAWKRRAESAEAELSRLRAQEPLTAQQLDALIEGHVGGSELADGEYSAMVMFAAAVERAHGIYAATPRAVKKKT